MIAWEPFQERSLGSRLRSYARFGHTGEAWGIVGQTVAGLASFAGVMLVWTGIALAWRRMVAYLARKRRARDEPAGAVTDVVADAAGAVNEAMTEAADAVNEAAIASTRPPARARVRS